MKTATRILSLLLTVIMMLGTVPALAESEPITLTILKADTGSIFREDSIVHAAIEEATGFNIDLMLLPNDELINKINTMAASNQLPDIIKFSNWYPYAAQGQMLDITDLLPEYGQNLLKYLPEHLWEYTTYEGRIVGIPYMNDAGKHVLDVRQDWLDKLSLEAPATIDEMFDVAVAFATQDPDGNGTADSYGFSSLTDMMPIFGAFGIPFQGPSDSGTYYVENNEMWPTMISPYYKEVLAYMNRLWEAKAIDPDIFVMKEEQRRQKITQGKIGMGTNWWSITPQVVIMQNGFFDLNPDGAWTILDPITGPGGPLGNAGMKSNGEYQDCTFISANSKNPEAALQLLDWLITDEGFIMAGEGIEDVHYTWNENGITRDLTEEGLAARDEKWRDAMSQIIGRRLDIANADVYLPTDDVNEVRRRSYIIAGLERYPLYDNLTYGLPATEAETMYKVDVDNHQIDNQIAFITGERSLDEYDQYVQEWLDCGGRDILESKLEQHNELRSTDYVNPFN